MNIKMTLIAICLIISASCGKPMSAAEKIAMLENQQREITADLYRQQAECQAKAIEFANMPNRAEVVTSCANAYRAMAEASMNVIASFDKRIAEIRSETQGLRPLNGKLGEGK